MFKFFKTFNLRAESEAENQFNNNIIIENISHKTSLYKILIMFENKIR